jgi:hypothetical protein
MNDERPPKGPVARSGGPDEKCSAPLWPGNLTTPDLEQLVRKLDAAVRAAVNDLPRTAEHDDLVCASALARTTLRRRRAAQRVDEARQALLESGWSA